jgi:tetratricopeptide (TPR) repeat protein
MKSQVKIALVTTCKGRLSYLRESLETWLNIEYEDFHIVVVDYDCPDGTAEYISRERENFLTRTMATDIRVVKVENKSGFNLSEARNTGIQNTDPDTDLYFMVDVDVHVKSKKILKRVYRDYKRGVVFFSHMPVLNSRYFEGLMFYRHEYGQSVNVPAILPMDAYFTGSTGTVCVTKELYEACGGYDPEIGEAVCRSFDIEFALRYLNNFFYRFYVNRPAINELGIPHALDAVLGHFDVFPDNLMREIENPENEKSRFYPEEIVPDENREAGNAAFAEFVHRFFDTFEWQQYEEVDIKPVSLQEEDFDQFPLPPAFREWFACWYGKTLLDRNQLDASKQYFEQLIKVGKVKVDYLSSAYFFLAEIRRLQGKGESRGLYFRSLTQLLGKRQKKARDLYYIGTLYQKLGKFEKARLQFEKILESGSGTSLYPRIYLHMGEMEFSEGNHQEAKKFFQMTLKLVQDHPKATDYINRIDSGQV